MKSIKSKYMGLLQKNSIFQSGGIKKLFIYCILVVQCILIYFWIYFTGQNEKAGLESGNNIFSIDFDPLSTFPKIIIDDSCQAILSSINSSHPVLLLDQTLLSDLLMKKCKNVYDQILLGIDAQYFRYLHHSDQQNHRLLLYQNASATDYIKIYDNITRIIPRMSMTYHNLVMIPNDIPRFFEFWKRSKFLEGSSTPLRRPLNSTFNESTIDGMARLTRYMISFNMYPFIFGGTLLGWYREGNVISHTNDVDLAVLIEELNLDFITQLQENKLPIKMLRKLGKFNDSFELTVKPRGVDTLPMDIFFMYWDSVKEQHWVGGLEYANLQKYRYSYPKYEPYCACDLKGHLFWITCNPHEKLKFEYGPDYMLDIASSNFIWSSSHHNVKKNGKFLEEERDQVYIQYTPSSLHIHLVISIIFILFIIY